MNLKKTLSTALLLICSSCGAPPAAERPSEPVLGSDPTPGATASISRYETLPPELREAPPPEAPTPAWSFPAMAQDKLPNQLGVVVVERHTLPLVQLKLVIRSGQATDRDKRGLAVLSGEMLKVGGSGSYTSRQLLNRIESLGTGLSIVTSRDATSLSMNVTSDRFEEAMTLLGLVIEEPRFDTKEFAKLRRREADRVSNSAKSDPAWAGSMVMYSRLFGTADPNHPYASFDSTEPEIEKRALWEVKQWVNTHVTPENSFLLVVGDVTLPTVKAAAEKVLGSWKGKAPKPPVFGVPSAPTDLQIVLVDRPKSSQADIRLATLGPERKADDWAATRVANQILGGGASGRLFLDVREKQSLAYSAYSTVEEVVNGPSPMFLRAATQTAKAGLTLKALLDHAALLSTTAPNAEEVELATQYLSDVFLVNVESVGDVAALTTRLGLFGLPNDYYDRYRVAVRETNAQAARGAFARYFKPGVGLVVVAGDAERLATPLSHFGNVEVVDPEAGFKTTRKVPKDPNAPFELDRVDGT